LIYFDTGRKSTCCVTGTSKIENVSRIAWVRGWIQPVCLRGRISVILGSQVSLPVHYRKKEEVYFTTLLWQNKGRQNGLTSRLLFSKLNKIMVKKVTFVGLRGGGNRPPSDHKYAYSSSKIMPHFAHPSPYFAERWVVCYCRKRHFNLLRRFSLLFWSPSVTCQLGHFSSYCR